MDRLKDKNVQISIGVIVLVVVVLGIWWLAGKSATVAPGSSASGTVASSSSTSTSTSSSGVLPGSSSVTSSNPTAPASGESVSVADQAASSSVAVSSVTLQERGWVAVRDSNGVILGAALFPAGTHTDVSVPLLRATAPDESYQVLLYVDNGNKQFDLHGDTLIINADGSVAGTTFKTFGGSAAGVAQ